MKVLHIGINTFPNLAPERAFRECGHQVVSVRHIFANIHPLREGLSILIMPSASTV
jgi:hypothetical protein